MPSEETKGYVASFAKMAERRFKESGNEMWAVAAVAECYSIGWSEPEWAKEAFKKAVVNAWSRCVRERVPPSLSPPAGRGQIPPFLEVLRYIAEDKVKYMVVCVHHCFKVSVEDACDLVCKSVDIDLVREVLEMKVFFSPEHTEEILDGCEKIGLSREFLKDMQGKAKNDFERYVERLPEKIQIKIKSGDVMSIRYGDHLSVGVESLAQKFHREKWAKRLWHCDSQDKENIWREFEGAKLLSDLAEDLKGFDEDDQPVIRQALAKLRMRPNLACLEVFLNRRSYSVRKS